MTGAEISQAISDFLAVANDFPRMYEYSLEMTQKLEDETQDILHLIECADASVLVGNLREIRQQRRVLKNERECTRICKEWYGKNKNSINMLNNALGELRKVLRGQNIKMYRFKTNVIREKDSWLSQNDNELDGQLVFWEGQ